MTEKIRTDPKLKEIYAGRILLGRFAEPEEIVRPLSFWLRGIKLYNRPALLCGWRIRNDLIEIVIPDENTKTEIENDNSTKPEII